MLPKMSHSQTFTYSLCVTIEVCVLYSTAVCFFTCGIVSLCLSCHSSLMVFSKVEMPWE